MAYMSQDHKKRIAAVVKPILKKHGLKGSLRVRHHSTIVLTIREGAIDFFSASKADRSMRDGYINVNHYWIDDNYEQPVADVLNELKDALQGPEYYDRSDAMIDYFDTSHYIDLQIGEWNKPYKLVA